MYRSGYIWNRNLLRMSLDSIQALKLSLVRPDLHRSRKDRKHMVAKMYFKPIPPRMGGGGGGLGSSTQYFIKFRTSAGIKLIFCDFS